MHLPHSASDSRLPVMFSPWIEKKYNRMQRELASGVIALIGVGLIGTFWYKFIEGWRWIEAAYMTVITLATVGFLEVHPLGDRGRLFTMVLIGMGIITIGYIVNLFTEAVVEGYFQEGVILKQRKKLVENLTDHYIVCGYGRMGRHIASEFAAEGIPFVVIDLDVHQIETAHEAGHTAVIGDATLDDTLIHVGIERAVCVVAALPSDAENLYVTLSAKTLSPQIRAIARANTEEAVKKLQRAGADAVVSPYITGGKRMAAAALRPQVMDFVDGILTGKDRSLYMEEFLVDADCPYAGQSLREARLRLQSGALVLAIRRSDGSLIAGPTGDTILQPGDLLICMGTPEQLRELNQLLVPIRSPSPRPPKH